MDEDLRSIDNWVVVYRIELLMDAYLLKAKLELEEIEVQILDELTVEAVPFYSTAIGGIRIQVRESQKAEAIQFLHREGYLKEEIGKPNKLVHWLNATTLKIPFLRKFRFEFRLLVFVASLLLMLILPFALGSVPSISDQLVENTWCVREVRYKNEILNPDRSYLLVHFNNCAEMLDFSEDRRATISAYLNALKMKSWNEYKGGIYIHSEDSLGDSTQLNVFEGAYTVHIKNNQMKLVSPTTRIICERM